MWEFLSWSLRGCSEPASQARGLAWFLEPGVPFIILSSQPILRFSGSANLKPVMEKVSVPEVVQQSRLPHKWTNCFVSKSELGHVAEEILEKLGQRGLRFLKGWKKRFVSAEGKVVAGYLQLGQVRDVLQC